MVARIRGSKVEVAGLGREGLAAGTVVGERVSRGLAVDVEDRLAAPLQGDGDVDPLAEALVDPLAEGAVGDGGEGAGRDLQVIVRVGVEVELQPAPGGFEVAALAQQDWKLLRLGADLDPHRDADRAGA